MAKKVTGNLKLQVPAGAANPSPPIGPALGQRGINIMEFCKAFNARTQQEEKGTPLPVVITYLPGQVVHLRDQDAAGVLPPEAGGEDQVRLEAAGPRHGRHGDAWRSARDRREEAEGSEHERRRRRR